MPIEPEEHTGNLLRELEHRKVENVSTTNLKPGKTSESDSEHSDYFLLASHNVFNGKSTHAIISICSERSTLYSRTGAPIDFVPMIFNLYVSLLNTRIIILLTLAWLRTKGSAARKSPVVTWSRSGTPSPGAECIYYFFYLTEGLRRRSQKQRFRGGCITSASMRKVFINETVY